MKIEIKDVKNIVRVGAVTFGSCIFYNKQYYIVSELNFPSQVVIVDLNDGKQVRCSMDTMVCVVENAVITGSM